jgi:hypothetical protein
LRTRPIRVALKGAATRSTTGAYTPAAMACSTAADWACVDSHSAISTSPSALSRTSYTVLPRKPDALGPWVAEIRSSRSLSSVRAPGLA